jgi:glycine/D-amino acid oxidase-like deaminating enzyme
VKVIICGAGVIGTSIAYALAERGVAATVVEMVAPACAASGKAGGFLARDWCDGSEMQALARRSFALHAELGASVGDRIGYRALDTLAVVATEAAYDLSEYAKLERPQWLHERCAVTSQLGSSATTAQVHPALLTRFFLDSAKRGGAQLLLGQVDQIHHDNGKATGVSVDGDLIEADVVVVAMGPWSTVASQWLPLPAIAGERGASIVLKPRSPITGSALFGQFIDLHGDSFDPEVFPRPDGSVYLCGVPDRTELPDDPASIAPNDAAISTLLTIARILSDELADAELVHQQACFRPIVRDALPVMGMVPDVAGAYVATAHNCWGILNAPATGEAMAELILTGTTQHVDLHEFDPRRLL